jgi:hypothetical protein
VSPIAFVHGKDSYIAVDSTAGGSLASIGVYVDSIEGLPGEQEFADVTALGDEGHKNIPGLENGSFSLSGHWDVTLDAIFGPKRTVTTSFEYGPAGNTGGLVKYSGECWVTSYTVSSPVGDKVAWSASCQIDGQVTRGTF